MAGNILEEARDVMRRRHYSIHTERTYCDWIKRYIQHFNMQSRADLCDGEKLYMECAGLPFRYAPLPPQSRRPRFLRSRAFALLSDACFAPY